MFSTKFQFHALFLSYSKRFKDVLDSGNVHNLMEEGGPRAALEKHIDLSRTDNNHIRIISCGGDGTTGWILSVMDTMKLPAGIYLTERS